LKKKWIEVLVFGMMLSWLLLPLISDSRIIHPNLKSVRMDSTHYLWRQTFGGIEFDEGTAIVETADGGFAISGRTQNFGEIVGVDEVWLVRCDADGNHLWNHTYGGGMIQGGKMHPFHKSVRLEDLADGGFLISSHKAEYFGDDADAWLIHTDTDGNHLWNYTFGGPDDEYLVESVECSAGGYISAGWTENVTLETIDYWLLRTDANGIHLWNKTYGSPTFGELCYNVIEVSSGGFLMVGWAGDFGYAEDDMFGDVGSWVVCVDDDGNHLWNHTYGTERTATYAVECQDGDFAFVGVAGITSANALDVCLTRIDADGQHLWNQTYGDFHIEAAFEFAECSDGGFAIFTLNYISDGDSDAWFVRTDENGTALWNQTYGGMAFDQFFAGIVTSDGDFVTVGTTKSFGAGDSDMWVVRIPDEPPPISPPIPPPIPLLVYGVIAVIVVTVIVAVVLLYRRRN
jgi:hypothetical protein